MIKFIKQVWKKVPMWIQDVLSFITSLASIITMGVSFALFVFNILKEFITVDGKMLLPWLLCIFLLVLVLFMRSKMKQYKKNMWLRLQKDASGYYKVLHDFRNFYFDILSYYKDGILNSAFLTSITRNFMGKILDELCDIYYAYTGKTINACIKLIGKENEQVNFNSINIDNATVYTFIRSSNISKKREDSASNEPVLVKNNTDFKFIISPPAFYNKQYFYEQDLHDFESELKKHNCIFENTTLNYWDFYRAAIVVPIRIAHSRLHFTNLNNTGAYHIVGFLCIDTMSTNAFIPEFEEEFIKIAKSFASLIYIIMNKYNYYLVKCKSNIGKGADL